MHHIGGLQILDGKQKVVQDDDSLLLVYLGLGFEDLANIVVDVLHDEANRAEGVCLLIGLVVDQHLQQLHGVTIVFKLRKLVKNDELSRQKDKLLLDNDRVFLHDLADLDGHNLLGLDVHGLVHLAVRPRTDKRQQFVVIVDRLKVL